ncbi:histidinol dehydrogenase/sulfopropanediol 3-dehydrogenase [Seinonella peptonophila]|uniref:Histidinol dehydrogenase n=1 Tax=Seinonella peptonophila TaxID=112248 RepID=A0A1M4V3Y0_9BACL|nr:histidinol dehydrogenase [Seinonella peptonophila]SHE63583.1 histidinol dehydrogenase/sulfopropanediol 3-dehydrogenase [Seinonella peptonophila]
MVQYLKKEMNVSKSSKSELEQTVASIIDQVRQKGDAALLQFAQKFDGVTLQQTKVTEDEIQTAGKQLPQTLIDDIQFSIERIRAFAVAQKERLTEFEQEMIPGVHLGQRVIPIEAVGSYVPGGRYPLLSSAQMSIIPAKVAGVSQIRVCTPPTKEGHVHPAVLYAAHLSGADEIFAVGGAQAIAALAYGTESIQPVNKIAGPGNRFVTEAKKQVQGDVGIDLLAGPSEVLVVADEEAKPQFVATDLLAQAEHDVDARAILVTTSADVAHAVMNEIEHQLKTLPTAEVARASWERRGQVIVTETLEEAIQVTNDLAPEHLHVQIKDAYEALAQFTNYGSLFLGENASVVYADKVCGTNHILPTQEAAKYTGGVWVGTFLKVVTYQWIEQAGIERLAPHSVRQSKREGLIGHLRSANIRLTGNLDQ